jgi:hypothetical protein
MMKRIEELDKRENRLRALFTENLRDDSSNLSEPEGVDNDGDDPAVEGDITEHASWYCTMGRELTESSWNPYWESQERQESAEEMLEVLGTFSTTVSPAASMSDGSTDGQSETSEMCHICLWGIVTQEVGTPEACNHSFCADCLQEWLEIAGTCPIDRQVCHVILVRRCLGGEVVRKIHVEPRRQQEEDEVTDYFTHCKVYADSNRLDELIHCD